MRGRTTRQRKPKQATVRKMQALSSAALKRPNAEKTRLLAEKGLPESLRIFLPKDWLMRQRLSQIAARDAEVRDFLGMLLASDFIADHFSRRQIRAFLGKIVLHNRIPRRLGPSMRLGSPAARIQKELFEMEQQKRPINSITIAKIAERHGDSFRMAKLLFQRRKKLERTLAARPKD
jgi:hypothetical protein